MSSESGWFQNWTESWFNTLSLVLTVGLSNKCFSCECTPTFSTNSTSTNNIGSICHRLSQIYFLNTVNLLGRIINNQVQSASENGSSLRNLFFQEDDMTWLSSVAKSSGWWVGSHQKQGIIMSRTSSLTCHALRKAPTCEFWDAIFILSVAFATETHHNHLGES